MAYTPLTEEQKAQNRANAQAWNAREAQKQSQTATQKMTESVVKNPTPEELRALNYQQGGPGLSREQVEKGKMLLNATADERKRYFDLQKGNTAPTAQEFADMNKNATTVGEAYAQGERGVQNVGSYQPPSEVKASDGMTDYQRTALRETQQNQFMENALKAQQEEARKQTNLGKAAGAGVALNQGATTTQQPFPGNQWIKSITRKGTPTAQEKIVQSSTTGSGATVGGQTGQTVSLPFGSTGVPQYDQILQNYLGLQQEEGQMNIDIANQNEAMLKRKFMQSIGDTTLAERLRGMDTSQMSLNDLFNEAAQNGLTLTDQVRDRIQAGGKAELDNLLASRNDQLAEVQVARNAIEREFNRALNEREQFNVQQDTRMRRLLGAFGGGVVESSVGNAEVMRSLENGQRAKEDLIATYADKQGSIARAAQGVIREYTTNINKVEQEMAQQIEGKYADMSKKIDELIDAGVTNERDLQKALFGIKKEYAKTYENLQMKALDFVQKENERLFEQTMKIQEAQRKEDAALSDRTGYVYSGGQVLTDQYGRPVENFDNYKFKTQEDRLMSQVHGYMYDNGRPLLDSKGNPIPTWSREKEAMEEQRMRDQDLSDQTGFVVRNGEYAIDPRTGGRIPTFGREKFGVTESRLRSQFATTDQRLRSQFATTESRLRANAAGGSSKTKTIDGLTASQAYTQLKAMRDKNAEYRGTYSQKEIDYMQSIVDQFKDDAGDLSSFGLSAKGTVSQAFGVRNPIEPTKGNKNIGTDIAVPKGTQVAVPDGDWEVISATDGVVGGYIGHKKPYGNSVLVRNNETGEKLRFSHLSEVGVGVGDVISGGQLIGKTGATGNVTGAHLDLEYYDPKGGVADVAKSPYGGYYIPGARYEPLSGNRKARNYDLYNMINNTAEDFATGLNEGVGTIKRGLMGDMSLLDGTQGAYSEDSFK